jgi:hypothetical protein
VHGGGAIRTNDDRPHRHPTTSPVSPAPKSAPNPKPSYHLAGGEAVRNEQRVRSVISRSSAAYTPHRLPF